MGPVKRGRVSCFCRPLPLDRHDGSLRVSKGLELSTTQVSGGFGHGRSEYVVHAAASRKCRRLDVVRPQARPKCVLDRIDRAKDFRVNPRYQSGESRTCSSDEPCPRLVSCSPVDDAAHQARTAQAPNQGYIVASRQSSALVQASMMACRRE